MKARSAASISASCLNAVDDDAYTGHLARMSARYLLNPAMPALPEPGSAEEHSRG